MLSVAGLFIYPIKSLAGIELQSAKVTDRGLEYDRRWMLVDVDNKFISQRSFPKMALCKPRITSKGLIVSYPETGDSPLIPFITTLNEFADVTVWDDTCRAQFVSKELDAWFSNVLGLPCRLVYMPDDTHRPVDPKYAPEGKINSLSDGYPFLLIGQASMDDLTHRTGETVPINRFRPNIVFTGGTPYQEDELAHFRINNIDFYGVKICARCPIPGIEQETALRVKEPLKTLNRFRRMKGNVWVGQNLIHSGEGYLNIGDTIEVMEMKAAAVFD